METKHTQMCRTLSKQGQEEKFIALNAFVRKLEKAHTSSLIALLKALEQKEANKPKRSRQQKINSGLKSTKKKQRLKKTRTWFFEKNQKDR
jgi:hypothetical protein